MSNFPAAATGYPSPTTGSGVSAAIALSSGNSTLVSLPNSASGVHQYSCQLSLAHSAVGATSISLVGIIKDAQGNTVTPSTAINAVWKAYTVTSAVNAKQSASNFSSSAPSISYSAYVVSLGAPSGTNDLTDVVTAQNVGQSVVECQFPTFANTEGTDANTGNPKDMIYVQVLVNVAP